MEQSLFVEGLSLMFYGMGTVFLFLIALVGATKLMSAFVVRFSALAETPDDPLFAAVAAAVHRYRQEHL